MINSYRLLEVSLINIILETSQVCLALISQHSCLESHLSKSKMKMKNKKKKRYSTTEIVKHLPIGFKICISLDVRNHLSGQQHTSLAPRGAKGVKTEAWRGSFPESAYWASCFLQLWSQGEYLSTFQGC